MHYRRPIRLPPEVYGNPANVFHVVIRAFPGQSPFERPEVAGATWGLLDEEARRDSVVMAAACLMPDHLHLLLRPNRGSLVSWVGAFKSVSTRRVWQTGYRGRLWQPSFWDRCLRENEFDTARAYIINNPVSAGLVDEPGDWPWTAWWDDPAD
ncbi:MAG: transposase [Dehalococcoidia bacterium]|nr:transposase [Dehalococcoidia bacterium]